VLTVREEFLLEHRPIVQQLVTEVLAAGRWLDTSMNNRFMGAEMAAKPEFFNQKPELIKFVMSHPMDRVTYSDLVPRPEEFDQFMTLALEAGMLERPISPQEYVDDSFAKAALEAERRAGGPPASDATIRTGPGQAGGMKMDRAQTKGIGR
jgi:NitT/TauT family transport system substrate-binding protein